MGAKVTMVDAYGPGNSRSTSGDETRGVRSSYGDKTGQLGELWMLWARESIKRWIAFDDEWGREFRLNLFHTTGDLIMRTEWDNFQLRTKVWWDKNKIPYQVLNPDDVRKAFPVISMDDITAVLYEPDAGVVRARRSCRLARPVFRKLGGKIVIGRATPSDLEWPAGGDLARHRRRRCAETFVFASGSVDGKNVSRHSSPRKRAAPIGTSLLPTPVSDHRFTFPNLPSYNFPRRTGGRRCRWTIAGFRVRGAEAVADAAG
jgi:glycine/D-amino acid oxidase-like deaminating enzyme